MSPPVWENVRCQLSTMEVSEQYPRLLPVACPHVGVPMWVSPCGCPHVGVPMWVSPCGSSITWLIAALLMVPSRFSRAAGRLAASPVMTPWPRRRPGGGGTLLFLNLAAPPRGAPPPGNDINSDVTHGVVPTEKKREPITQTTTEKASAQTSLDGSGCSRCDSLPLVEAARLFDWSAGHRSLSPF